MAIYLLPITGCSFLERFSQTFKTYSKRKGAPFILRRKTGHQVPGHFRVRLHLYECRVNRALTCYLELISKNQRITSDWVDLLGGLPGFKDWLRFGSTNLLYFVRKPGHVELRRDPRFDF